MSPSDNNPSETTQNQPPPELLADSSPNVLLAPSAWDRLLDFFVVCSHVFNIGFVLDALSHLLKFLLRLGSAIPILVMVADPLIYLFKSLYHVLRLTLRYMGVKMQDEKHGAHPWHSAIDVVVVTLFVLAILFFVGVLLAGPQAVFVGWTLGLVGVTLATYINDYYPYTVARARYYELRDNTTNATSEQINSAEQDYKAARRNWWLMLGLVIGLTVLLLCGSAAVFAPPAIVPILMIAYKVATAYLIIINLGRLAHWLKKQCSCSCLGRGRTLFTPAPEEPPQDPGPAEERAPLMPAPAG